MVIPSDDEYDGYRSDAMSDSSSSSEDSNHFMNLRQRKKNALAKFEANHKRTLSRKQGSLKKKNSFKDDPRRLSSKISKDLMTKVVEEDHLNGCDNPGFQNDDNQKRIKVDSENGHRVLIRVKNQENNIVSSNNEVKRKKLSDSSVIRHSSLKYRRKNTVIPTVYLSQPPEESNGKIDVNIVGNSIPAKSSPTMLSPDPSPKVSPRISPKLSPRMMAAHMKRKFSEAIQLKPDNLVS